jgi:hypothetical protein
MYEHGFGLLVDFIVGEPKARTDVLAGLGPEGDRQVLSGSGDKLLFGSRPHSSPWRQTRSMSALGPKGTLAFFEAFERKQPSNGASSAS